MRYLSDEWIAAIDLAVRTAAQTGPDQRLVVDQHVEGVIDYRIVVARTGAGAWAGIDAAAPPPDAAFYQTEATARAIARGDTDAHQAFLLGAIRFEGDVDLLIERRDTMTWLEQVLAPVMAATTF
jgi:hypothetical protein